MFRIRSPRHFHVAVLVGFAMFAAGFGGCASKPKPVPRPPTVKTFRLVHQMGGTHYRTVVDDGLWYQTFGSSLLVISPGELNAARTVELGKTGETGPATDLLIATINGTKRMFIVIEDDELLELSLDIPRVPTITTRLNAQALGLRPRRLCVVNGEAYVSGFGGVLRLSDRRKIFSSDEDVSRLAKSESGLIACAGRRAVRLSDGKYVGSATDFMMISASTQPGEQSSGNAADRIIFARQGEKGALVGLMSPNVREVDAERATVAVPGELHSMRVIGDRLWLVTDDMIVGYAIHESSLDDPTQIDVLGARDIAGLKENQIAIAGTFGRALYKPVDDPSRAAEGFLHVQREPSKLSLALTDGRHILAGSREGLWMYLINSRVDLTTRQFDTVPPPPQTSATAATAQAQISEDGRSVTITPSASDPRQAAAEKFTWSEPNGAILRCVVAVDGDFWVGHDRGLTVLRATSIAPTVADAKSSSKKAESQAASTNRVAANVRIAGPVRYIYPLLVGGGASFVSEFGGFGVAKFVEEPLK